MSKMLQIMITGFSVSVTTNSNLYFESIRIDDIPAFVPDKTS